MKATVLFTFCLLAALTGTAPATLFYVEPGETIQAALDSCATGDTVLVGPGTYCEHITWPNTSGIKLLGEYGRDTTFIDGGDSGRVIWMGARADSLTVVRGFTIRNGFAATVGGGGILCSDNCEPVIEYCAFLDNWCDVTSRGGGGGGIGCNVAAPTIRNNHFEGNHSRFGGGGIGLYMSSPEIVGNTIVRNTSDTIGGGMLCHTQSHPVIRGNAIENDSAYVGGGIMMSINCHPVVDSNVVRHNKADWGGGLYAYQASHPTVTRCVIDSNVASGGAPGIFIRDRSRPSISHCFIRDNIGIGAVYCAMSGTDPTLEFCTISGNSYVGVGVEADCRATVRWSSLPHNGGDAVVALGDADARFNWWGHETGPFRPGQNPGGQGDTISNNVDFRPWLGSDVIHYVHPDSADNTIQAALDACAQNEAVCVGPGTYVENLVWPNTQGIRLASHHLDFQMSRIDGDSTGRVVTVSVPVDTTTVIHGLTIRNGYAATGGGGGMLCSDSAAPLIEHNRFCDNENADPVGYYSGGGLGCRLASPVVRFNEFADNHSVAGGGIGLTMCSALVYGNHVTHNHADSAGGGIVCLFGTTSLVDSNHVIGNTAYAGGGIHCANSMATLTRNTVVSDTAGYGGGVGMFTSGTVTMAGNTVEHNLAYNWGGGLYCYFSTPHLTGDRFHANDASYGGGIACLVSAWPVVDSCIIDSNRYHGIYCYTGAGMTIHNSDIFDNEGHALISDNADTLVDATDNWWGHATGPFHPTLNPTALGDTVSDWVLFDPWDTFPNIGIAEPGDPVRPVRRLATTFVQSVIDLAPGNTAVLLDITGRKVAELTPGPNDIRHLRPGVYFVRREDIKRTAKVILTR